MVNIAPMEEIIIENIILFDFNPTYTDNTGSKAIDYARENELHRIVEHLSIMPNGEI